MQISQKIMHFPNYSSLKQSTIEPSLRWINLFEEGFRNLHRKGIPLKRVF